MKFRLPLGVLALAILIFGSAALVTGRSGMAQDAGELDMKQIFRCNPTDLVPVARCDEARDLLMNNCTLCHIFVPIVISQFDSDGWWGLLARHVEGNRVDQLSKEQIETIHDYLTANFNPSLDPPELPPALLENWTSY
ncbi:MAG: hypothetical protein AB7P12_19360 [Alphaproteobacteria bacterium]